MPDRKAKPRSYHPRRFKKGDGCDAVASLILDENNAEYEFYHSGSSQDAPVINSLPAGRCPRCGSGRTESKGKAPSGVARRRCLSCCWNDSATTEKLLSHRKLPLKTMVRFYLNILSLSSISEASKVAKISMKTALFWMDRAFLALRGWQDGLKLSGRVWLDDKFIDVESSKKAIGPRGNILPGSNQWNVAIGASGRTRILILQGKSKSSDARLRRTWAGRIAFGSRIITDGDKAYHLVVDDCRAAEWKRVIWDYRHGKQCDDLRPINTLSSNVESWFLLHSGIARERTRIQDYLNLLSFRLSTPGNALKKAEKLMKLILNTEKTYRWRDKMPE